MTTPLQHQQTLAFERDGRTVPYTLRLEQLPLTTSDGRELGTMSAFSYVVDGTSADRPVLFLTNGGPGSATAFLHLSGIGPFRADVPEDLQRGVLPPYGLARSPTTILDTVDLVFIDAPRTGLGFIDDEADLSSVHSVEGDGAAFARVIAAWVERHGRWSSRKYFLGESYGTHRAAFLATSSHDIGGTPFDGIVLLGQAVNVQEVSERPGNVVGALANLPFKAATAWFHGRGHAKHATVEETIDAALEFAWGDLATAMLQGTRLSPADLEDIARRLSDLIGIPAAELMRRRLWMSKGDFRAELLKDKGLGLGANDARYAAPAPDSTFGEQPIDAANTHLMPRYVAGIAELLDDVLKVSDRPPYKFTDMTAALAWDWDETGASMFIRMGKPSPFHAYPYPARLSRWMKQSPGARLMIGTGIYDSLTTVGAADHLMRQWELPADRTVSRLYAAGHMMYSDPVVAKQLNDDLRAFVVPADSGSRDKT